MNSAGSPVGDVPFIRSGLLGFVGPVSDIFMLVWVYPTQIFVLCKVSVTEQNKCRLVQECYRASFIFRAVFVRMS